MSACTKDFQERATGTIDLRDDDPDAIHAMVSFMYRQSYPAQQVKGTDVEDATLHINTWTVADKYDVQDLAKYAASRFATSIPTTGCWRFIPFGSWVAKVFQDTPAHSPLREHCVRVASRNANELYNDSPDYEALRRGDSRLARLRLPGRECTFQAAGGKSSPEPGESKESVAVS